MDNYHKIILKIIILNIIIYKIIICLNKYESKYNSKIYFNEHIYKYNLRNNYLKISSEFSIIRC